MGAAGVRSENNLPNPVLGRNTLFDGIFRGHLDIMRFLLDSGADMEAADFCSFTPRDLAFQRVNTACPPELAEHLRTLFRLDEVPDDLELTTVHRIVLGMTTLDLGEYLSEHPPEVNKPDLLGRTPLWWAVRRDDATKSHTLLARGADPNIANAAGRSPLHNAAAQGNLGLVDALLKHSADVHQRSFEGKTPLHVVGVYGIREDVLIVQRLLDSGAEIDAQDSYGRTAISLCCFDSHAEIAQLLLERGADLTVPDAHGWFPWHWAIYDGAARIVERYLTHGDCDLGAVVDGGGTVLHFMVERCTAEQVVDAMLAIADMSMIDPDAKDSRGKTASENLEERWSLDVSVYQLDEKLGRMIDKAARPRD
ncbi:hypothetical protein N8I77_013339 [Diaporthe amygdali]|uniref:Uncharacterized protein n=1 Tax=Phomopsis amygdali TaxID=1214568 RepID=A0AAD9VWL0_PHOAM|nr:hypothetical protein N8I77_013339 [Diaporthe amygdali]